MPDDIKDDIASTVIHAIEKAHDEYLKMNGEKWLWAGPEYFLTVNIAKELKKMKQATFVDLEFSVKDTLFISGGKSTGRPKKRLRIAGRFDIVVWGTETNKDDEYLPLATIEVKNKAFSLSDNIILDMERLIWSVKSTESSIRYAIFAFYTAFDYNGEDVDQKIDSLFKRFSDKSLDLAREYECKATCYKGKVEKDDNLDAAWSTGAIVFHK